MGPESPNFRYAQTYERSRQYHGSRWLVQRAKHRLDFFEPVRVGIFFCRTLPGWHCRVSHRVFTVDDPCCLANLSIKSRTGCALSGWRLLALIGARNFSASGETARLDLYVLPTGPSRLQTCNCTISPFRRDGSRYLRNQLCPFLKICPRRINSPRPQPCYHGFPVQANVTPDAQTRYPIPASRLRLLKDPSK